MAGVTKEQIEAAKRMTAIEFLQRYRPGELVKAGSRGEFQLREHDSFKINGETSKFHWKSQDIGGKSALDYLVKVEKMKFVDAVLTLCNEIPGYIPPPSRPRQKKEFILPAAAENNRRVFAYLIKRGIRRNVIETCIRSGNLYESARYHNAVFIGKDETGTARYAFLRGTYTYFSSPFKAEIEGSDKRYCFCIAPREDSVRVAVYESAVDAMAHQSLEKTEDKYRLSLGGIYAPKMGTAVKYAAAPAALESFLSRNKGVREIEICTDNDYAGRWAAEHIEKAYQDRYRITRNLPGLEGRDYGDLAKAEYEEQAVRQRGTVYAER